MRTSAVMLWCAVRGWIDPGSSIRGCHREHVHDLPEAKLSSSAAQATHATRASKHKQVRLRFAEEHDARNE